MHPSRWARSRAFCVRGLLWAALAGWVGTGGPAGATPIAADGIGSMRAVVSGQLMAAPDRVASAELVVLERALALELLQAAPEETVRIEDWPIAPGLRETMLLTRHDVYAPDARIFKVEGTRLTELPRSRLVFFWGRALADETSRAFVAVDPDTKTLRGLSDSPAGLHEIRPFGSGGREHVVAPPDSMLSPSWPSPSWSCDDEEFARRSVAPFRESAAEPAATEAITTLHTAIVAVDTDNELMLQKFSDNTTSATNYIASLFAAMNVMYERDLLVRLKQGTTFLRVSTSADPYASTAGGNANGAQLNEFSNYWSSNYSSVSRALAMLLSGKQASASSASGIAWVTGLCNSFTGNSVSQVFKIDYLAGDALVVGHEIGHNFGSPHTHCYSPPIDACYSAEPGCYSGAVSCPAPQTINGVANVTGTIMSYCHLLGGCSSSMVFHPRTVSLVSPNISSSVGTCIFPLASSTADLSGDGRADILLRNYSTGQNAIWAMTKAPASGLPALSKILDLPALPNINYRIEGVGDFNGDGKPDIVWRNYLTGQNAVWLMNGTSLLAIVDLPALPNTNYHIEGVGDFNGNGKPDIILRNHATGQNAVWLMNGTSLLSITDLPALPNVNYHIVGSADFNGDGKPDMVWRNYATGQNSVWLMSGTSLLTIVDLPALPNTDYHFSAIADYNYDAKPDIVIRNTVTGQDAIWLMNGTSLSSVVNLPTLPNTSYEFAGPR
jgi:hypothetical protein